jgi:transglutaminase-like putative cysteine protease
MMKIRFNYLSLIFILLPVFLLKANTVPNEYSVKNIPPELLKDVGAVIRNKTIKFEIYSEQNAIEVVKVAVTIFKKDEQHYGELKLWYDNFREIIDLEGVIYDQDGEEVRELESSDIKDYSDYSNYSLYADNRIKSAELYYNEFPYTVEYTYELRYNGFLEWPSWYSRYNSDPVEFTKFEVKVPFDYRFRYWCNRDSVEPDIRKEGGYQLYSWQSENLPKLNDEAEDEDIEDLAVVVRIAPSVFNMDGYKGNMTSWKDYGRWYSLLCKDKDSLPKDALREIDERIASLSDKKEKIFSLYKYMQSRTRYVSVQLGIGGWQPFDAEYVHKNRYGDCKALSNYMVSILKAAGITAYPVLIYNGDNKEPLIPEFPSNQFDHVIVCVPLEKDTIWLECTSQNMPPGSIGWSNENRSALMITPGGGVLVKTPATKSGYNKQQRNSVVTIRSSGRAEVNMSTKWFGDQYDYVLQVTDNLTPRVQEKWLKSYFKVAELKMNNYSFTKKNDNSNEIDLKVSITLPRYGSLSGNRIFFNPCIVERRTYVPDKISKKISPVRFNYPFTDIDTVKYILPDNYKVEALPKEVEIETSFGKFVSKSVENKDGPIIFIRLLEIKNYSIAPENYSEYRDFFAKVVKADRSQIVLVKK